ncbi:MAG: zinc ribbon domain-containing protein [Myxococcales bacterium]|nr:zinc ribbon domain-containing protein [Myxococcales bacterium]
MVIDCPHCGTRFPYEPRHGLNGVLCPSCSGLVSLDPPRDPTLPRAEEAAGCFACGAPRDPDARRCRQCGVPLLYRVVLLHRPTAAAEDKLVAYIARRAVRSVASDRITARLHRPHAVVEDRLTETLARQIRREIAAFGVESRVERDDAAPPSERDHRFSTPLIAAAVLAVSTLAIGIYLLLRRAPEPIEDAPSVTAPPARPDDVLATVALLSTADGPQACAVVHASGACVTLTTPAEWPAQAKLSDGEHEVAFRIAAAPGTLLDLTPAPTEQIAIGNTTALVQGVRVYAVDPVAGLLVATEVDHPDEAIRRQVFLRLRGGPSLPHAAPIVDVDGRLVGLFDAYTSKRQGTALAVPIETLREGDAAVLARVLPPRAVSPTFAAWQAHAVQVDRAAHPDLYAVIDGRLLEAITCDGVACLARLGVLTVGDPPAEEAPHLAAFFFDLPQSPERDEPAFGQRPSLTADPQWQSLDLTRDALMGVLPTELRQRLLSGEVEGLALYEKTVRFERPAAARGGPFRVVFAGLAGRRGEGVVVGARAP